MRLSSFSIVGFIVVLALSQPAAGDEEGFVPLFNGKDLSGWKQEPGHKGHWQPKGQFLDYDGKSEAKDKNLWSEKQYGDFVLKCDWRWTGKPTKRTCPVVLPNGDYAVNDDGTPKKVEVLGAGDSGIYLRGSSKSQVNMWFWPVGSGEVYGYRCDKAMPAEVRSGVTPKVNADKPIGQWNRFIITMKGDRLTVQLNGQTVIENAQLPGVPPRGPVALQHHGDPIQFANIFIKELDAKELDTADGFVSLFDGKTLTGWRQLGGKATYAVEDGTIVGASVPNTTNSFLCTEKHYADFMLEMEFKVDPELNSGVQIRSHSLKEYKNGRVHGYQVEIDPSPRSYSGGIYDESRRGWLFDLKENEPARKAFKPNEWNKLRIEAVGDSIKTWINGVQAADLVDSMTPAGFIALQVHGVGAKTEPMQVRWRNIRIKEL